MVDAGLRGVSGFWPVTRRPDAVSMIAKLTALPGRRSAAMAWATGAGICAAAVALGQNDRHPMSARPARVPIFTFNPRALECIRCVTRAAARCAATLPTAIVD